jgi:hypothetical protein
MRILKFAIIGAVVAAGITLLAQKREDGTSILDDITESAPDWMEKAKDFAAQAVDKVTETVRSFNDTRGGGQDEQVV